jgi:hypothetical protein
MKAHSRFTEQEEVCTKDEPIEMSTIIKAVTYKLHQFHLLGIFYMVLWICDALEGLEKGCDI